MELENISQGMVQHMKDNGKMIIGMEKASKHGLMEHALREITITTRKMEKENYSGWMETVMLENLEKIVKAGKES